MGLKKSDMLEKIHSELGLSRTKSSELLNLFFEIIKESLAEGKKVHIPGFGHFILRDKAARMGRNPQTGAPMRISARRVLSFRPSQVLREDIAERYAHRIDRDGKEDLSIPDRKKTPKALDFFNEDQDSLPLEKEEASLE